MVQADSLPEFIDPVPLTRDGAQPASTVNSEEPCEKHDHLQLSQGKVS